MHPYPLSRKLSLEASRAFLVSATSARALVETVFLQAQPPTGIYAFNDEYALFSPQHLYAFFISEMSIYAADQPLSAVRMAPLTLLASLEARKAITEAICSG